MNAWTLDPEEEDEVDHDESDYGDDAYGERQDRSGSIELYNENNELVLIRTARDGGSKCAEMLRLDLASRLLRIFPKTTSSGQFENQFQRIVELQIYPSPWDPHQHSALGERYDLLHAVGLPAGFSATYEFGLGINRDYRDFVDEIEKNSTCTIVRFTSADPEGPGADGITFCVSPQRFERYRAAVDRNRGRGRLAVSRVVEAECHNAVADLFGLDQVEPKYTKHKIIRALTEEVSTGHVMDAADRAVLIDETARAVPEVAREEPKRFGLLRTDIELVSLEVLIDQFERSLRGGQENKESYWQSFFEDNQFALQQLFSMPIIVKLPQAHVQAADVRGRGSRITDFLCANTVTRSAVVVEIKTPGTQLMVNTEFRGKGTAAIHAPHIDLSGSVAQIQSQMAAVQHDLPARLPRTPELSLDPWNDVRGAVIVGRISKLTDSQRESFLRYRAGLVAVTVLGYDEVLDRLKDLLAMLKASPGSDNDAVTVENS